MKILVTGSNSQIANSFLSNVKKLNFNIYTYNKIELDITNYNSLEKILYDINPNVILNCAAYTNVDKAELESKKADEINNYGVRNLSIISNNINSTLLHFSTDYVFDGSKNNKYNEDDKINPLSSYAKSKYRGECQIIDKCKRYLILRVSWLFSQYKKNFVKFVLNKLKKNEDIFCIIDQIGIPTCADDVSKFIIFLINNKNIKKLKNVYNFVNNGPVVSWYQFSKEILKIYSNYFFTSSKIIPVKSKYFFKNDIRPKYSALNNEKIINDFNFEIDNWKNSLNETIKKIF